ncbi:Crp/Fnr family transcriptional regulator [Achromobacter sp. F4_2707]|uniref:Crp/Fnr family transcriptional regulator n=1 Tax=Achromobacter sp. F4_2707 TaxID=3114286 RepID=UPI0039C6B23B
MSGDKDKIRNLLMRVPLFDQLDEQEIAKITAGTTEHHVRRGEAVFHRGEPCNGFHIMVYGQVKLVAVSPAGAEKVMRLLGPGESFGEALMFLGQPYILSAVALADSMLLTVDKSVLLDELDTHPMLARKMLAGLSKRLHSFVSDVKSYSLHSGTQRVIGYLLQAQETAGGPEIRLEVGKNVIASRLNLTPEHFSRILHDLTAKGLIRVEGRNITILDDEGFRVHSD